MNKRPPLCGTTVYFNLSVHRCHCNSRQWFSCPWELLTAIVVLYWAVWFCKLVSYCDYKWQLLWCQCTQGRNQWQTKLPQKCFFLGFFGSTDQGLHFCFYRRREGINAFFFCFVFLSLFVYVPLCCWISGGYISIELFTLLKCLKLILKSECSFKWYSSDVLCVNMLFYWMTFGKSALFLFIQLEYL